MAHWQTLAREETPDGVYELRQRGPLEFLVCIDGRILMNSRERRSEEALAQLALETLRETETPRVLVGGLGMGITLRVALESLPAAAHVVVVELQAVIAQWCRGPLECVNDGALDDPRVALRLEDVSRTIASAEASSFDAIVIDLFEGPHARTPDDDPCYGTRAVRQALRALRPGGVYAIWGEAPDARFERRLDAAGFRVEHRRPGRGGLRHVVYLAQKQP